MNAQIILSEKLPFNRKISSVLWKTIYIRKTIHILYDNYFLPKVLKLLIKLTAFFFFNSVIYPVFFFTLKWLSICYNWRNAFLCGKIFKNKWVSSHAYIPIQISFVKFFLIPTMNQVWYKTQNFLLFLK